MKNWFSNAIQILKPARTLSGVCFKIRQPKPKFHLPIDEKTKIFWRYPEGVENKIKVHEIYG